MDEVQKRNEWIEYISRLIARERQALYASGVGTYALFATLFFLVLNLIGEIGISFFDPLFLKFQLAVIVNVLNTLSSVFFIVLGLVTLTESATQRRIASKLQLKTKTVIWIVVPFYTLIFAVLNICYISVHESGLYQTYILYGFAIFFFFQSIAPFLIDGLRYIRIKRSKSIIDYTKGLDYSSKYNVRGSVIRLLIGIILLVFASIFALSNRESLDQPNLSEHLFISLHFSAVLVVCFLLIAISLRRQKLSTLEKLEFKIINEELTSNQIIEFVEQEVIGPSILAMLAKLRSDLNQHILLIDKKKEQFHSNLDVLEKFLSSSHENDKEIDKHLKVFNQIAEEIPPLIDEINDYLFHLQEISRKGPLEEDEKEAFNKSLKLFKEIVIDGKKFVDRLRERKLEIRAKVKHKLS